MTVAGRTVKVRQFPQFTINLATTAALDPKPTSDVSAMSSCGLANAHPDQSSC